MIKLEHSEGLLKASLVASILVLSIIAGFTYVQFQSISESQKNIIESYQVQRSIQSLATLAIEAETTQRAYFITKDSLFLWDHYVKKSQIPPLFDQIKTYNFEDSTQNSRLLRLEELMNSRILNLDNNLIRYGGEGSSIEFNKSLVRGNALLEEIKELIQEIKKVETDRLTEEEVISEKKNNVQPVFTLATVLFSLVVFSISYLVLFSSLRRRLQIIRRLKINQAIYEQVEKISDSGHWYFQIEEQKIVLSPNFFRLLGYEPNSFIPDIRFFFKTIISQDRQQVISSLKDLKKYGEMTPIDVRVQTKKGEVIALKLIAGLIKDEHGKDLIIGANKDVTKENNARQKMNQLNGELQIQNNIFKASEEIAETGSYSYVYDTGESEFSDNLYRILGYAPGSFVPSVERFLDSVFPGDLPKLPEKAGLESEIDNLCTGHFRIIDKYGAIKFLSSKKKIMENAGSKIMIVTFKDVTEELLISKRLEEKNKELSRSIEELDSFNHIASHDLQEPLRKIQTFISRLLGFEDLKGSALTLDYLARIQKSANRMQKLIIDLLAFSRVSKETKNYSKSSLMSIVEEALQELAGIIEEKNARIFFDDLPEITVISFQMRQLFVNLISNSLKYAKEGIPPLIKIPKESLNAADMTRFDLTLDQEYVKITVEDNGIGFDQKYADTIFVLFQRLHDKSQYSGTGIGLSICKKIMDHHQGFLYAEGMLGVGSKFSIILPSVRQIHQKAISTAYLEQGNLNS